ncbi:TIGR03067 domain-containing protein [Gemmata sp.]|uniref:TIGR03067 domain-containing protein n=1 Tax=Gemmata sp. TaxID=1914242 RepID=UPI003F6ED7FE
MSRYVVVGCLAAAIAAVCGCKRGNEIEGTYVVAEIEVAGEKLPKKLLEGLLDNERMVAIRPDKIGIYNFTRRKYSTAPYKLDNTKVPAEIDMVDPDREGVTDLGIYKLEGDLLTICSVPSKTRWPKKPADGAKGGGVELEEMTFERPTEFKTTKDTPSTLVVLKVLRERR